LKNYRCFTHKTQRLPPFFAWSFICLSVKGMLLLDFEFRQQHVQVFYLMFVFLLFVGLELHNCNYNSENEIPPRNLIRRIGIDAIILILTLPFTISKLGPSAMDT